jgi:hypothetical protein
MGIVRGLLVLGVCAAVAGGCGRVYQTDADRFVNLTDGTGYDRGLVVCLSGAGGMTGEIDRFREGLVAGGVRCAIESFEWSTGWLLVDQSDLDANRRKAVMLARRIEAYRSDHPGCPVHLIGVSAGTGLIVWALEALGPGQSVDNAFLIASSLSDRYDLRAALGHVAGRLYSHYSAADLVLALGVPLAGTVDRRGGASGGLVGFKPPGEAGLLYQAKLMQVAWESKDAAYGHLGDHLGGTQPGYICQYVAAKAWARDPEAPPPAAAPEPAAVEVAAADR